VQLIEQLDRACIRFVHFSKENELRSRVFSEKMGLESGWNCHISLLSEGARYCVLYTCVIVIISFLMSLKSFLGHLFYDNFFIVNVSDAMFLTLLISIHNDKTFFQFAKPRKNLNKESISVEITLCWEKGLIAKSDVYTIKLHVYQECVKNFFYFVFFIFSILFSC